MTAAWVYRCWDNEGRLIYIGATKVGPFRRMDIHYGESWWVDQTSKVLAKVYPSWKDATTAETAAIISEHPRWNRRHKYEHRYNLNAAQFADLVTASYLGFSDSRTVDSLREEFAHRFPAEYRKYRRPKPSPPAWKRDLDRARRRAA